MKLEFSKLAERLLGSSRQYLLVKYIFLLQGDRWQHLDYRLAGLAVGADRSTVARDVRELAAKEIIEIRQGADDFELRIVPALIAA